VSHPLIDAVVWTMMGGGLFFIIAGAVGVLRLPDFYTRLHAQGKCDTLGVALMLGGLALREFAHGIEAGHGVLEPLLTALKIVGILFFIMLANPTATHALGRSALRAGLEPWTRDGKK
jgi:multicomponent Na+:H+ antiporter subunit G